MKNNIILYSVIAVLICLVVGMGLIIYQSKVADMDSRIVVLNNQITALQSQNFSLQSQNLALNTQVNQLMIERDKAKNLKSFASVTELQSFLVNNAGYNLSDSSDACVRLMLTAKNQGYWIGLMPKQTISYLNNIPYSRDYNYNSNCSNCNNCNDCSYSHSSLFTNSSLFTYRNNYNNYNDYVVSYSGVVNVAVVGHDLYIIESGRVVYAVSMSSSF